MFIFFALLFSLIDLVMAIKLHDRFDPARYFLLFWGGQIVLIYLFFNRLFAFSGNGLVFISIACLIFSAGTITGQWLGNRVREQDKQLEFKQNRALILLALSTGMGLVYVLAGIYSLGFNLKQLISFRILLELNNAASVNRYTTENSNSFIVQLMLIFVYATPLFGGYLLPLVRRKSKWLCFLSILPSFLVILTQSIKSGFITSMALWGIGVLVSSYANRPSYLQIKWSAVLKVSLSLVLFFSILFFSMIFRTGQFDRETVDIISQKFIVYAFGHLPAFDAWFTQQTGQVEPSYGLKTFFGISNYLGLAQREQGIFTEYIFPTRNNFMEIPPELETNVYTLFRFLIEDFGFFGSLIALLFTGMLSGFSWMVIKKQNGNRFFQVVLIAVLFSIAWSFVASVWAYASYIAAMVVMYSLLKLSFITNRKVENAN